LQTARAAAIAAVAAGALGTAVSASAQSLHANTATGTLIDRQGEPQARAAGAGSDAAERMQIWRKGSPPITAGAAENFTGAVQVLAPYRGTGGSRLRGSTVMFQPGARSAWHRHPLGQALIVTEGCGWTQAEGGPIEKICAGDVAWIRPGEKHWHGATLMTAMTHVTASESVDGQNVEWLEQVSNEEYARGPR
jgi:quercetin dioxygenase-like cupin family protein